MVIEDSLGGISKSNGVIESDPTNDQNDTQRDVKIDVTHFV